MSTKDFAVKFLIMGRLLYQAQVDQRHLFKELQNHWIFAIMSSAKLKKSGKVIDWPFDTQTMNRSKIYGGPKLEFRK